MQRKQKERKSSESRNVTIRFDSISESERFGHVVPDSVDAGKPRDTGNGKGKWIGLQKSGGRYLSERAGGQICEFPIRARQISQGDEQAGMLGRP